MKNIEISEKIKELEEALRAGLAYKIQKRVQAVKLKILGYKIEEISEITTLSSARIFAWQKVYREGGLEELTKDNYSANHKTMSFEEEKAFLETFMEKAKLGHVVTVQEMYESYQQAVGKETNRNNFYKILRRHEWRKVKPRPRHPNKADAEEIAASKKLTLKYQK